MRTLALIVVVTAFGTLIQARERWQKFDATAYSRQGQTASGHITREGKTAAADPVGTANRNTNRGYRRGSVFRDLPDS